MGARGEETIHFKGKELPFLLTNKALVMAEKQLGQGILGILEGFTQGEGAITEVVALLRVGLEVGRQENRIAGKPYSNEMALEILDELGFTKCAEITMSCAAIVLGYSQESDETEDFDPND